MRLCIITAVLLSGLTCVSAAQAAAPSNVDATPGDRIVDVSWTKVAGCTKYQAAWRTTAASSGSTTTYSGALGDVSSYRISGLTNGTKYYIGLQCASPSQEWTADGAVSATPCTLGAPTGLAAASMTQTSVTLSWTKNCGADGYKLYRDTPVTYSTIGNVATYTVTGLSAGTTYRFDIESMKGTTDGPWNGAITATTAAQFSVGYSDRGRASDAQGWGFRADTGALAKLGGKRIRHDGLLSKDTATAYKNAGVKVIELQESSSWALLRDDWNRYGPTGTVVAGVIDRLEVGNEESYSYKYRDQMKLTASEAGAASGRAIRSLKAAVPAATLVCQGDDGSEGQDGWFQGLKVGDASIAADCSEYSVHPYGQDYSARLDRDRGYITNTLGDGTAKFNLTEWGLSVRGDGGCVDSNYGWSLCMSTSTAASTLSTFVAAMKSRGDVSMIELYQNFDQTTNTPAREGNFGLLTAFVDGSTSGLQPKGALTSTAKSLMVANP